jgi:hypothetical protein
VGGASSIAFCRACSCSVMSTQCSASLSQLSLSRGLGARPARARHSSRSCELFFAAHRVELPNWKPDTLIDKKIRPAFGSLSPAPMEAAERLGTREGPGRWREASTRRSAVSRWRGPGLTPLTLPQESPVGDRDRPHPISPDVSMLPGKCEFVWTPKRRTTGI